MQLVLKKDEVNEGLLAYISPTFDTWVHNILFLRTSLSINPGLKSRLRFLFHKLHSAQLQTASSWNSVVKSRIPASTEWKSLKETQAAVDSIGLCLCLPIHCRWQDLISVTEVLKTRGPEKSWACIQKRWGQTAEWGEIWHSLAVLQMPSEQSGRRRSQDPRLWLCHCVCEITSSI